MGLFSSAVSLWQDVAQSPFDQSERVYPRIHVTRYSETCYQHCKERNLVTTER